jgi:hypothetical protein
LIDITRFRAPAAWLPDFLLHREAPKTWGEQTTWCKKVQALYEAGRTAQK